MIRVHCPGVPLEEKSRGEYQQQIGRWRFPVAVASAWLHPPPAAAFPRPAGDLLPTECLRLARTRIGGRGRTQFQAANDELSSSSDGHCPRSGLSPMTGGKGGGGDGGRITMMGTVTPEV